MGFQPMRQSLILVYLCAIFQHALDDVRLIAFLIKTNLLEKKKEEK